MSTGPVAKFVSEAENGRIGSAFKLGCPRMAVVKCGPARPIPRPFSNFATGPFGAASFRSIGRTLALEYLMEVALTLLLAELQQDERSAFVSAVLDKVKPKDTDPQTEGELA